MNESLALSDQRLSLRFEGARLSPAAESQPSRTYKIGWFVQTVDVNSAGVRYRCFHFARALAPEFKSVYLTSLAEVQKAISGLDAIVIVKRVDRATLDLVAIAKDFGVPVFLDLCDDLIARGYFKNELGVNLLHFMGMAPFLAGVTVSSAEMADRVQNYATDNGCSKLTVHVVPDIAETWPIYRATYKAVTKADLPPQIGSEEDRPRSDRKQVLWFGNFGARHSNFGMLSLKNSLKALANVNADIPLELVIVSNNRTVYEALVDNAGFPSRYVPWSATAVYSELTKADAALLTTGDDEFCSIKSSNRVLQALAAGVPVVTPKSSALAEFEDAVFSGRVEDSLRLCLGPSRARLVPPRMEVAERLLPRYSPKRLSGIWATLLARAVEKNDRPKSPSRRSGNVLFVVEPGDDFKRVQAALTAAKGVPDLAYELLISTEALEKEPKFRSTLRMPKSIPRLFSEKLKGARNLLLDQAVIVIDRRSAPIAKQLSSYADQLGVRVLTTEDAVKGALAGLARKDERELSRPSAAPGGEWTNPDGSVEWSFVVHRNARGWILDAICREIGSRQPQSWHVTYYPEPSPSAKNFFFSHYMLLERYLEKHSAQLDGANVFVWYTHPRVEDPVSIAKLLQAFDKVTKVIFACESNRQIWIERGLPEEKAVVVLGAADPDVFRFHDRSNGVVGLSSSFYERKNPDLLLQVLKRLPNRWFVLLGKNWNRYALFEEMRALPNFNYMSAPYNEYPNIYSTFDVFLSISSLEGGPIPLVEAMMSNAVPVASRTGFAPDLIEHGKNGFIFDLDASAEDVAEMIEAAFALSTDVRATVENLSWEHFSAEIVALAE